MCLDNAHVHKGYSNLEAGGGSREMERKRNSVSAMTHYGRNVLIMRLSRLTVLRQEVTIASC